MTTIEEKWWNDMKDPEKQKLYEEFVEEETEKYKARKEEELLHSEED